MFGQKVWRPVAVAVVTSAAAFLPQGVAVAATPGTIDTVTCSQVSAELRNGSLHCSPLHHDGVNGVFIGPVSSTTSPAGGATTGSASTSGGTGSTTTTSPTTATTTEPTTDDSSNGNTGASGSGGGRSDDVDDSNGSTGSSGSGSSGDDDSDDNGSGSGSSGSGSSGSSSSGSDRPGSSSSGSGSSDDSSGSSGSGSSDDSSGSSSSSSSSGSSGSSYSTNSGTALGAAACPTGVGGTSGTTGSTATGSVDTSAATPATVPGVTAGTTSGTTSTPDTSGVASVTDVTGGGGTVGTGSGTGSNVVGTVTSNAASTAGSTLSSVAGTVTNAAAAVTGSGTGTGTGTGTGNANLPADVIDLSYWYLTLPTGSPGSPETIENPNLEKFTNDAFKVNNSRDGVVFSARADGVTTKNSHYPRSELREMNGSEKAAWSNTTGSHTLDVCEAITKTPTTKPEVVAAQIHDASDDVMQIRLEGKTLMVQYNDGKTEQVIDPNYALGTPYNVRIVAEGGKVDVLYNGQKKAELPLSGSGWYWKVGAYVQSNTEKGESPDATGEVTVYSLKCVHT